MESLVVYADRFTRSVIDDRTHEPPPGKRKYQ
jgi:hypothetical protein